MSLRKRFNQTELYLFFFLIVFAVFSFILVIPYSQNSEDFQTLNPVLQYILFNLGFIVFSIVFINIPFRFFTGKKIKIIDMFKIGLAGWLLFSFIFDLWQPPYYLSTDGEVLIKSQQALPFTAVDGMLAYLWSFLIPANFLINNFSLLYIAVYIFTPIITVFTMMVLFKPDVIKKAVLRHF